MFAKLLHPEPGRHWKAMTATIAVFVGAGLFAVTHRSIVVGAALMLFILILGVQWLCIAPPGVDEKDIP